MQSNFTTERLNLTSLTSDNDEFIFELVNTPGWLRFIGDRNIRSVSDARAYIEKIIQNPLFKYWLVALSDKKTPIGIITLIKRDYLEFRDIGFAFLPAYTQSGYAYEAASVVLNYLADNQKTEPVLATTIPDNTNSIRLLTKLGFEKEKEIELNKERLFVYRRKDVQRINQL